MPVPLRLITLTALRTSSTKRIQKEGTLVTRAAQRWPPFVRMARRRGRTQARERPSDGCATKSYYSASGPLHCAGNKSRLFTHCYVLLYISAAVAAGVDTAWRCVDSRRLLLRNLPLHRDLASLPPARRRNLRHLSRAINGPARRHHTPAPPAQHYRADPRRSHHLL